MRKIAIIITQLEMGGAQMTALDMAEHFASLGDEVIFITNQLGVLNPRLVKNRNIKKYLLRDLRRGLSFFRDKKALRQIRDILLKELPDIVHTHSSKAGILGRLAAKKAGIKYIFHTVHGFGIGYFKNPLLRRTALAAERRAGKISTGLVFVSRDDMRYAEEKKIGKSDRYHLIRSGIDYSEYGEFEGSKEEMRKKLGIGKDTPLIVNVAPFKRQKNLMLFIDMIHRVHIAMPKVRAYILGDGKMRKQMEGEIEKRGLKSVLLLPGFSTRVRDYVKAADLFLSTSLWEGLPRTLIESFLLGTPVIAPNIGGIREVVKNDVNGYLYEHTDVDTGVDHVLAVLNGAGLKKQLSKGAVANVPEEFSKRYMLEKLEDLYNALG